jgi:hypothetical protein
MLRQSLLSYEWAAPQAKSCQVVELAAVRPDLVDGAMIDRVMHCVTHATDFDAGPKLRERLWRLLPRLAAAMGKQVHRHCAAENSSSYSPVRHVACSCC